MRMLKKKGQSTVEYALIFAVVVAGLLLMQNYMKRGYAGRLRSSADDVGSQYDPAGHSGNFSISENRTFSETVEYGRTNKVYSSYEDSKTGNETISAYGAGEGLE